MMKMNTTKNYWRPAILMPLLIAAPTIPTWAQQPSHPLVFAHYMHAYILGGFKPNDPRLQNPGRLNDIAHGMKKSEDSEFFPAKEAAIAANGQSAVEQDFQDAAAASVDDFGMLLSPTMLPNSAFSAALNTAASVAQHNKIKLIPELWVNPYSVDCKLFGQHIKQFMDAHPGAFLTHDGKPIFILEADPSLKPADPALFASRMNDLFAAWGGMDKAFTIAYGPYDVKTGLSAPFYKTVDALSVWNPQDDWAFIHGPVAAELASDLHKQLMWPVSRGFYQRHDGGNPHEYGNGLGAAKYIDAWLKALQLHPPFVDIQTWNDFSEDTAIRPTNATGDTFVNLTRFLHEWIDRGSEPPVTTERVMLFHPKQLANATLDDPTAKTDNFAWRHRTPTVDYIDCVAMLNKDSVIDITLGKAHWEQAMPAGFHEWLIYVPQQSAPQRGQVAENPNSYPTNSAIRFVTTTQPFNEAIPELQVKRQGNVVLNLRSRAPYLGHGQFQELTLIGDEGTIN